MFRSLFMSRTLTAPSCRLAALLPTYYCLGARLAGSLTCCTCFARGKSLGTVQCALAGVFATRCTLLLASRDVRFGAWLSLRDFGN